MVSLKNGILIDERGYQGEVVSNTQFQFDPVDKLQPGRIYDSGFCVNGNKTLSIGGSAIFYYCISGNLSNLYTNDIGSVCSEVFLDITDCGTVVGSSVSETSTSSTSSTTSTTPTTTPVVVPTPAPAPAPAAASPAPAPYPVGNTTTPAVSGTATTVATTTSPVAFQPSSGANVIAIGSQLMAGIAAVGAFALF